MGGGKCKVTVKDEPGACAADDEGVTVKRTYKVKVIPKHNHECEGGEPKEREHTVNASFLGSNSPKQVEKKTNDEVRRIR